MMRSLATFALLATTLVNGLIIGERETNAQRLQRGMQPLKPAKLFDASRTGPELAGRSATVPPPATAGGYIAVVLADRSVSCYIGGAYCTPGTGASSLLSASTFSASLDYGPQDIVNSGNGVSLYLSYYGNMVADSPEQAATVSVAEPPPTDTPGTYASGGEGGVWTIASNGQISAMWTNEDGTPIQLSSTFLQSPTTGDILACPDSVTFNTIYQDAYNLVTLYFIG